MLKKKLKPMIMRNFSGPRKKKIIFLDRDGVINRFPGMGAYVTSLDAFHFIPGSLRAIQILTAAGFEINIISNQGCVSRGMISETKLSQLTLRMMEQIKKSGGLVQGVFYCVHQISDGCLCKKPNVTLLKKAIGLRKFLLKEIFFIGDSREDMQAAKNLKCQALLVLSGRTKKKDLGIFEPKPDVVKKNLLEAARWIIQKKS